MQNFTFHNPTRIIFGADTIPQIGAEVAADAKKILLVYGRNSIKKNGIYQQVTESLKAAGVDFIEHAGVQSNPLLSHTRAGIELAKAEKVQAVVAVGGGSVLDESKAIALGACADNDVWDFFSGTAEAKKSLPLFTVLTIAATGSEMNNAMVVTNEETQQKYGFFSPVSFPKVSILDPALTCSVPADYSAFSAVDAISHLLEGYFTHQDEWAPIQDGYVENLIRTIIESQDRISLNPNDLQARATFMWSATLALNGLPIAGVGDVAFPNHMIEHSLSAFYGIAHGAGLAIVLPAWMTWESKRNNKRLARFAREVFKIDKGDDEQAAVAGITALTQWFKKIGAPTSFEDAQIPCDDINKIAANAFDTAKLWGIEALYSQDKICEILQLCSSVKQQEAAL